MKHNKWIAAIPFILGIGALLVYINLATGIINLPMTLSILLAFAIGPAAIGGMLEVYRSLQEGVSKPLLQLAIVFLVIAFSFFTLMLVVQQAIFIGLPQQVEETVLGYDVTWAGLNLVQLGIDIAFDIFYSLGLLLLGLSVATHPDYGKLIGYLGSFLGLALLVLNMSTFPIPPAEDGLIDVGPLTAFWWLLFIGKGYWTERRAGKK